MLELLRKDASKFLSKILLGFIVFVFILYFGYNFASRRRGGGIGGNPAGVPVATVNGMHITAGAFHQDVENQMSIYNQFGQGQVPPDTQKMVEGQILQRLIHNELFAQAAYQLGLRVTDLEMATDIRSNRSFQKDGQFNEAFYLDQFKPFYEKNYGQDYEYALRQELLGEKLQNVLEKTAVVSQQQIEDHQLLQNTKLKVLKLEVSLKDLGTEKPQEKAAELAKEWIGHKKSGQSNQELLKNAALKEENLDLKSLYELEMIFGKEDSLPVILCLIELKPGQICEEPFRIGNNMVAVELLERQEGKPTSPEDLNMAKQLTQAKKNQILTAASDLLLQKAKIETY